eukprot:TRINITY_DN18486_c0_g1_i1.p1 TRINITY_DN18486_c0_g1~~TRINITY_DN18486_c0_g1_i1.p1  ORF type:complete len:212 (+),score=55.68 TRINITY_DN18486_c0_g1_i1:244-879(+)
MKDNADASVKGVDNTFRRKWDRDEYERRAKELDEEEEARQLEDTRDRGPPIQRAPLRQRDFEVNLESRLGKTQVVTPVTPLNQQAGYFCKVCDCVVKDSANYLDHINGKKHQRALGMSMRVERSSLSQVQERFDMLKRKQQDGPFSFTEQDLDTRIQLQVEEEEALKRQRKERKKEKREAGVVAGEGGGGGEMDDEMAALMGFGGFGSSKR